MRTIAWLIAAAAVTFAALSLGLRADTAFATRNTVWLTDKAAAQAVKSFDPQHDRLTCYGYGHRKAGTQKWRRFDCLSIDPSGVVCTFEVRFTTRGIGFGRLDCS
jgi:uncharacterized protein YigE (DUF2233 family)